MDPRLLDTLRNAPSLELYQLNLMVNQLLADPKRILEIRRQLHLGVKVMFFLHSTNALAAGTVLQLRPKEVCVQDDVSRVMWWLPYAAIVPHSGRGPIEVPSPSPPIASAIFQIGDTVGFTDKYLREHVGIVARINDKTISIDCDGERWRVPARLLRKIVDI
ncbi:MAG: hypothetical protein JWQ23_1923 [Herminiimonas sp.]|nr:hypothetical protein [Herminiimonas sp.]